MHDSVLKCALAWRGACGLAEIDGQKQLTGSNTTSMGLEKSKVVAVGLSGNHSKVITDYTVTSTLGLAAAMNTPGR